MSSNHSQNTNNNSNTNQTNRMVFDQLLSTLRSGRIGSDNSLQLNNGVSTISPNSNNLSHFSSEIGGQQQGLSNAGNSNLGILNSRFIVVRRDNLERNNQRGQQSNRSTSYQYINNSNRVPNHLIIESQVINMSPMRLQSSSHSNQQHNSNHHLDSDNESASIFDRQDEKDYIFGTENLAVTTENIDFVKCTICMHIYQNPIACGNCLNHFCTFCIREWLTRNPNSCPLCKNFREMRCVPMLKNMLDKLQFFCTNKRNGCDEIIRYEQVVKHEDQCEYKIEVCPVLGCGASMIKKLLDKHTSDECEYVLSKCRWCDQSIKKKRIEEHEETCDQKEVTCELCGEMFQFKDSLDHEVKCPELIRECAWCQKEIKQKDIRDHEDCCGERIVRCQGCNYECCLNDHFLHNQTCQEIPVFCHRCQTKMKRKEQSAHTIELCIENIQKSSSQKIFQLENENRELKRQLNHIQSENQQEIVRINNILTRSNLNQPFSFSQVYKDQDIFVSQKGNIALVREYKKKRRDRFVIADQPKPLLDSNQTITFKILSRRSEWFAIGICDESNVYSSRRYHDIGHLSYLISANGILYSSHSPNENWQNRLFQIEQDNVISIQFIYKPGPQMVQNQQQQMNSQINLNQNGNINSSNIQILSNAQNNENSQNNNNNINNNSNNNNMNVRQIIEILGNNSFSNIQNNSSSNNNNSNVNSNIVNNNDDMRQNEGFINNPINNNNNNNINANNIANLQGVEMKLKFINHTENQELVINLDPKQISEGRFYYCACLRCPGDSVEILPNF